MTVKLLLVNPPSPFLENSKCEPPLGLLYVAGAVRELHPDVEVKVMDLGDTTDYVEAFLKELCAFQPSAVGLTAVTPQYGYAKELLLLAARHTKAVRVVGGAHASSLPDTFTGYADVVVSGPGELPMCDIITRIKDGKRPDEHYAGSHYPMLPEPVSLPARHLIDLHSYSRKIGGIPATTLTTSWGCPSNCHYCAKSVWKKFRLFSADFVCRELDEIYHRYGYRAVLFVDDTFTYDPERLKVICAKLKALGMKFRCWTRVDCVTPDMLATLRDSGCVEISFGIESGSQKLLDIVNKQVTVEQNRQALRWAKEAGIVTKAFLMVGIPGETKETVEETKQLIAQCDPDQFILSTFTPIVGSPVWFNPEKYGIVGFNRTDFEHQWEVGNNAEGGTFINTKWLSSEELKSLHHSLLEFLRNRKGK